MPTSHRPVIGGTMAGFVQLVEFEASDIEDLKETLAQFRADHPEVITALTTKVTEDRDRPGTYIAINEFESYESAMEQSNHPLMSKFAELMASRMTGRQFRNLDVLYDLPRP
jgi:quinol monooxygenase YgiN